MAHKAARKKTTHTRNFSTPSLVASSHEKNPERSTIDEEQIVPPAAANAHGDKLGPTHSFMFRAWIGFLIGLNVAFVFLTLIALLNTNPEIEKVLTLPQGIALIVVGILDIYFMICVLQWKRFAVYGTIAITVASMCFNIFLGATIMNSILFGFVPLVITLSFVIPLWSQFK